MLLVLPEFYPAGLQNLPLCSGDEEREKSLVHQGRMVNADHTAWDFSAAETALLAHYRKLGAT